MDPDEGVRHARRSAHAILGTAKCPNFAQCCIYFNEDDMFVERIRKAGNSGNRHRPGANLHRTVILGLRAYLYLPRNKRNPLFHHWKSMGLKLVFVSMLLPIPQQIFCSQLRPCRRSRTCISRVVAERPHPEKVHIFTVGESVGQDLAKQSLDVFIVSILACEQHRIDGSIGVNFLAGQRLPDRPGEEAITA